MLAETGAKNATIDAVKTTSLFSLSEKTQYTGPSSSLCGFSRAAGEAAAFAASINMIILGPPTWLHARGVA
jgi:hypothetical protein